VKIYACEIETGAPLIASYKSGRAATNADYVHSFVEGISAPWVLPEMFDLAQRVQGLCLLQLLYQVEQERVRLYA